MLRLGIWPDLRLRTKGLIVIAFPAAATVLIACASYILGTRAGAAEQAVIHSLEAGQETQRLKANEAEASAHVRAYFITGEEAFANKAREAILAFDTTLQKLEELTAGDESQAKHVSEIAALERWRMEQIFGATARFRSGALPPEALRAALRAKEGERLQMERVLGAMQGQQERLLQIQSRDVERLHLELRATTGICVFFGVVGGVLISLLFASGITNRIGKLQANVSHLATGGVLEPLPGGRDEIGALSEGVAQTAEVLRQRTGALENALHGIAQVDAAGCYLSFNKAYAEIASLSSCNKPANVVVTVCQDDRVKVEDAIHLMRTSGRAETEVRIPDAFGCMLDVAMTFRPVSADASAGYYVFLRDISLRKETEAALVRAKDDALAASLAKNDFLAKISHDIRTPLNAILGAANLLSETPLSPDQKEYVSLFQRNSGRLVTLINDFLDFSKIEAGALRLEKVPFRIRGTVEDAVATFRESASRKGVGLEFEIGSAVPEWELGDPLRVQQVLVNLLSNAVKFTEQGQVTVRVLRTTSAAGDWLSFEVLDTGPGIRSQDQERVFSAFTQLSKQNLAGAAGCGLGLTICRELVERMGGEVGVSSQPGRGSRFYFSLPLEAAQPVDAGADGSSVPAIPQLPDMGTLRVLVAEDTEDNRLLLTHYLRKEPVEVTFVADGQRAVDAILAGGEFDLILMDLDMPRLDGYGATKFIREWQRSHGQVPTPIVALSAHAMREAEQASLAAGCNAHLAKPVDKATLLSAVHRYGRSKSVRQPEIAVADGVAALVPKYLASKPKQIEEARASLAVKDFDPIWRFGHNLKGTGRAYGFPPIEEMGKEIEKAAADHDEASIAEQLENLGHFVTQDGVESRT
jgi:signal transduction histidine kinase/CheY-like chemotaxis protein/CHASE3 domain sensor protein/HPt (histidine-containing phosphotransfer) domain-containing protein